MERKATLVVGRLSMMAAIVLLAPVDGLNVLSDFWRDVHVVLGVESCDGVGVVERVWGSGYDCSLLTLPGVLLCLGALSCVGAVCMQLVRIPAGVA